jgi:hypothetical protein
MEEHDAFDASDAGGNVFDLLDQQHLQPQTGALGLQSVIRMDGDMQDRDLLG